MVRYMYQNIQFQLIHLLKSTHISIFFFFFEKALVSVLI